MTIHRYEVTDAEWAIIEPMLPKHHMGRPQKDLRAHFNGILWIARSGARWEDLPARYGPHQTVYSCFCRWRDDGTLERIFHALGANAELEEARTKFENWKSNFQRKKKELDEKYKNLKGELIHVFNNIGGYIELKNSQEYYKNNFDKIPLEAVFYRIERDIFNYYNGEDKANGKNEQLKKLQEYRDRFFILNLELKRKYFIKQRTSKKVILLNG